jgi:hypothetical protein
MNDKQPKDLSSALERLTLCLQTPCLPGDVEEWAQPVLEAVETAGQALGRQISVTHGEHFAGILEQDVEMFRQVVKLKAADQTLLDEFEKLAQKARRLVEKAPRVEPDEGKLRECIDGIVHEGLAFVLACQQQEIALRSWLQEAFVREVGVGD